MAPQVLPSGIVTFVFTDIEQSTRALRSLGDRYAEAQDRHFAVMRRAWSAHQGREISTAGDSVFVAFARADDAVRACAAAQRLLTAQAWPEAPLRVRMGIHAGLASPRGRDYVALAVHQAARVMAAAHGGQVLLSDAVVELLGALTGVALVRLGRFRLRDFDEPVTLYMLAGEGLPAEFPAVRALPADGHNLVPPGTSFQGRQLDTVSVVDLIQPGRVVTLTGPGGVGKTRLATHLGIRLAPQWSDGVWLIDAASLRLPEQLADAIAGAVGAPAAGGDRWADVIDHLRLRRALLLADSCEQLGTAAVLALGDLLHRCPHCGVLATSRVPLALSEEVVWRVAPLALPDRDDVTAEEALQYPAVRLFMDRARTVRPDLRLDDATAPVVVAICRRLDGLPLALELAAARLGARSLPELLAGLDDQLHLLRSHNPAVPERQRTMTALLDWSYELLGEGERACLRRLSVFGDGFSVEEASAAASGDGIDPYDVPELVWSLVDKSLVTADLTANDTRYRLLETVRAFAAGHLARAGETVATALRLADWYLARFGPGTRRDRRSLGDTAVALPNLRALVRLVAPAAPDRAQLLAATIGRHLDAVQAFRTGIDELGRYRRELSAATPARIAMLSWLAYLYLRSADVAAAEAVLTEAEALRAQLGDLAEEDDVFLQRIRGDLAMRTGDVATASEVARRALDRDLGLRSRGRMSNLLGIAAVGRHDLDTAWRAFGDELRAYEQLGDVTFEASAHGNLAEVALRRGDCVGAAVHQRATLALALELGAPGMVAFSLIVAARLAAQREEWAPAVSLHAHAEGVLDDIGLALYDGDRQLSDAMLAQARDELGRAAYDRAVAAGRALDLPAAADLAGQVLRTVAG